MSIEAQPIKSIKPPAQLGKEGDDGIVGDIVHAGAEVAGELAKGLLTDLVWIKRRPSQSDDEIRYERTGVRHPELQVDTDYGAPDARLFECPIVDIALRKRGRRADGHIPSQLERETPAP